MSKDEQNKEKASKVLVNAKEFMVLAVERMPDEDMSKVYHFVHDGANNGVILQLMATYISGLVISYSNQNEETLTDVTDAMMNSLKDKVYDSIESINKNGDRDDG